MVKVILEILVELVHKPTTAEFSSTTLDESYRKIVNDEGRNYKDNKPGVDRIELKGASFILEFSNLAWVVEVE